MIFTEKPKHATRCLRNCTGSNNVDSLGYCTPDLALCRPNHTHIHIVARRGKQSLSLDTRTTLPTFPNRFTMSRPAQACLENRLRQLSLNSPPQTALFYARIFNALCPNENDHESAHILALCLLEVGETYSALHVVRSRAGGGCRGCAMIVARSSQTIGRFSEGQAVLEHALRHGSGSTGELRLAVN